MEIALWIAAYLSVIAALAFAIGASDICDKEMHLLAMIIWPISVPLFLACFAFGKVMDAGAAWRINRREQP